MWSAVDPSVNPFVESFLAVTTSVTTGAVSYLTPKLKWAWFLTGLGCVAFVIAEGSELRWRTAGTLMSIGIPITVGPLFRLPLSKFVSRGLFIASALAVGYSGWMEFFGPALSRSTLGGLTTVINGQGVCLQTTSFTCGPAAVVTVLRKLGVLADEGELGLLSKASFYTGTDASLLRDAVNRLYQDQGLHATTAKLQTIEELAASVPCATVVYYDFTTDHWVAVLGVHDGKIEIGDPISGKRTLSVEFAQRWKHETLLVTKVASSL